MTAGSRDWRDTLFSHRTYWQLVRSATFSALCRPASVAFVAFGVTLTLGGFAIDQELLAGQWSAGSEGVAFVRTWAVNGLTFGSAMLAFLIAGFTVFATVTDVRVFQALAGLPNLRARGKNKPSHLQTIFVGFMMDFWYFVMFLALCVVLGFIFAEKTPATALLGWTLRGHPIVRSALIHLAAGLMGTYLFLLLAITKSFIWNVYQSVLIAIALKADVERLGVSDSSRD